MLYEVITVPLLPFHTWLADAHTEAPTSGSVVLAGVLLKMGTYGLLRFAFPLFPDAAAIFAPYLAGRITSYNVCYTKLLRFELGLTRHRPRPEKLRHGVSTGRISPCSH